MNFPILQRIKRLLIKKGLLQSQLSEDELKQVLDAGEKSGALDKNEHRLIRSIFEFTETTVKEIMVPRPDIVAIDIDFNREQIIQWVIEEGYSRLPVFKEDLDHIIGVIYTKDLLSLLEHRDLIILQDIIRPAYFVPESQKISSLLNELQAYKLHLAIVIDEFGSTSGIITIEDIIEEIVGEIHDEYDEVKKEIERAKDGSVIIEASMTISDFNEQFNAQIPDTPDYETIAGFLQKVTGKFPDVNEEIDYSGINFTILSKSVRRIRQIRIRPAKKSKMQE